MPILLFSFSRASAFSRGKPSLTHTRRIFPLIPQVFFVISLVLMQKLTSLCFFLLILLSPLYGEDEIVVRLTSRESLAPLYLHFFQKEGSGLDPAYLKQLEEVLCFDLFHNGKTEGAPQDKRLAAQAESEDMRHYTIEKWKALSVDYVVKASVRDKKLSLSLFSVKTGQIKGVEEMPLTGRLASDRRQIHHASDAIHSALFNTPGIASSHILFTVRTKNGADSSSWVTEVWEADYDGANSRQVTKDGGLCMTPTYVPTRSDERQRRFLYVSYKIGQPKIYSASTNEGKFARLSYLKGNQLMPALSLKQDRLAFISDVSGNPDVFIQDFAPEKGVFGKPRQVFSAIHAAQGTPSFSPDGKQLAFVSNKEGAPRIYIMEIPPPGASLKEVKVRLISKRNRENTSPAWSPDGSKIAYSATTNGTRHIWIYDCKTGEEMQLTEGEGHKENPTWAPNSLHLVFNSATQNSSELYMINLHQKKAIKLATIPGEKRFPAWEPLSLDTLNKRTL